MYHLKQKNTKEVTLQNRKKFIDLENKPVVAVGAGGWWQGTLREFGMDMYTLLYLKRITKKDLLYSTGNSAQCYVAAWMGRESGGEWIHVCTAESLCCPLETNTSLLTGCTPI